MKQFYFYSVSVHFAVLAVFFIFFGHQVVKKPPPQVFTVDFIGGIKEVIDTSYTIKKQKKTGGVSVKEKKSKKSSDDIRVPQKKRKQLKKEKIVLSAPSVLGETVSLKKEIIKEEPTALTEDFEGAVQAEFPDFPYPWYITRVRSALWNEWSARMPSSGAISSIIVFKVLRNGQIKGLKVSKSSGNKLFDYAAVTSVQNSAPFTPLPDDYGNRELTVHVEFKIVE